MKRVAVYGGSFNPFHNGHLNVVRHAADHGDFDAILVVPSIAHAFKARVSPYEHRVNMATLALEPRPETEMPAAVSMMELHMLRKQPGPILTIELLRELQRRDPGTQPLEFRFVIGPDILGELDRWEGVEDIRREFGFYEVPEAGTRASVIREMIQHGDPAWVRHVPPGVARYIEMHRLYREAS